MLRVLLVNNEPYLFDSLLNAVKQALPVDFLSFAQHSNESVDCILLISFNKSVTESFIGIFSQKETTKQKPVLIISNTNELSAKYDARLHTVLYGSECSDLLKYQCIRYFRTEIILNNSPSISNESYFLNTLELLPVGIVVCDVFGTIKFGNSAFQKLLHAECAHFVNQPLSRFIASDGDFESYFKKLTANQTEPYFCKLILSEHKQTDIQIHWSFRRSDDGKITDIIASISNISLVKHNERELERERDLLQQLLNNIPDTIYFKNKEKQFTRINRAQAQLIGLSDPRQAEGKTDFDFFTSEQAQAASADEDRILTGGAKVLDQEELVTGADGRQFWMSTTKIATRNSKGEITGLVGISRDISYRKHTEEQLVEAKKRAELADKLKSAFLANMSHEIRTPMNAIIGFSHILKNNALSQADTQEYLSHIIESGNSLLMLIDDIIDFAKIEAGQISIKLSKCNLNDLLNELQVLFENELTRRGKENVRLLIDKGVVDNDFCIITDIQRLKQVISNIVLNAIKFTDEGFVKVSYVIDQQHIKFCIKDTGIGIAPDQFDVIFERFGQVDASLSRNQSGTGLGLTISKKIVNLLKGKIWLESELQKGTSFFFTIPFEHVQSSQSVETLKFADDETIPDLSGKIILIAEDEDVNFKFLEAILRPTQAILLRAHTGKEAIEYLEQSDFEIHIVLSDLKMPEMDGYEFIEYVRKNISSNLPVIAQTAWALVLDRERCLEAGFSEYISKPIKTKLLFNIFRKLL